NTAGVVTGEVFYGASDASLGFVLATDGTLSTFNVKGAGTGTHQGTFPVGINAAGTITGTYKDTSDVYHGFVRAADGTITPFDVKTAGAHQGTTGISINTAGTITGTYKDTSNVFHGFVRTASGKITMFDPKGSLGTTPGSINSAGVITGAYLVASGGYQGFERAADGTITTFTAPGAGPSSWLTSLLGKHTGLPLGTAGLSINTGGTIAGTYSDASNVYHGFVMAP